MDIIQIELIGGLLLYLVGILTLIISLTNYFKELEVLLNIHKTNILSIQKSSNPAVQLTEANTPFEKKNIHLKRGVLVSIVCFITGFVLQTTALLFLL